MIGADVDPSNGLGERRGVSPPVLHPTASPTKFEVPTGGLTPNACNMRVVFPETVALERQVCHCFGVLAEAVLLTLRRAKMTLPGHCLSQSGQAVAHPGGFHDSTFSPQNQLEKRLMAGFPSLGYRH